MRKIRSQKKFHEKKLSKALKPIVDPYLKTSEGRAILYRVLKKTDFAWKEAELSDQIKTNKGRKNIAATLLKANKMEKRKIKIKKIVYAPDEKIQKHGDFAYEFLQKVFGVRAAFLSDESSIYDFDSHIDVEKETVQHSTKRALNRIKKLYDVDVSGVKDLVLWKVLNRIKKSKS